MILRVGLPETTGAHLLRWAAAQAPGRQQALPLGRP